MDFLLAGIVAVGAAIFSNPFEVVKTRMQLQGELNAKGKHAVHYRNSIQGLYLIHKHDGFKGIQAGLVPALLYKFVQNRVRLGSFQTLVDRGFINDQNGKLIFSRAVTASALTSVLGAVVGSPLYLIKTQIQAKAAKEIACGYQHDHKGVWPALTTLYRKHGLKGLFRTSSSAIPRMLVGSVSQLTSFSYIKEWLHNYQYFAKSHVSTTCVASLMAGLIVSICTTPFDVVAIRLCNQGVDCNGRGLLYNGYIDCVKKMWNSEGLSGFYKGFSYLRIGPHSNLWFMIWDKIKELYYGESKF